MSTTHTLDTVYKYPVKDATECVLSFWSSIGYEKFILLLSLEDRDSWKQVVEFYRSVILDAAPSS